MIILSLVLVFGLIIGGLFSLNIIDTENLLGNSSGTFTIVFTNKRAVNGSGTMAKQTVVYGKTTKINKLTYKNSGYIFKGWIMQRTSDNYYYGYDSAGNLGWYRNCSKWYYFENQDDITNMANKGQTLRLYADWSKKKETYKIIYSNKHASNPSGTMKNQIISTNFETKLRKNNYKNGNNAFIGWVAYRSSDKKTYGYNTKGKLGWYKNNGTIVKYYYFSDKQSIKNLVSAGDTVAMIAFYKNTLPASNLTIYLSPKGNDDNIGTKDSRVQSLAGAQDLIKKEANIRKIKDVKIMVGPGTYEDQEVTWTYNNEGYSITITAEDKNEKTVFKCSGDNNFQWFVLYGSEAINKNVKINLTISYLKIEGYYRALTLMHGKGGTFSNITISNMYFNEIGTKYAYAQRIEELDTMTDTSDACLALDGITNSTFSNNKFYYIENFPKNGWNYDFNIHAIYVKRSTNNVITGNDFRYVSSDPIRLRDGANNNKIYKNVFEKSGLYSYVSEFYWPEASKVYSEPYVKKELASIGNQFYQNTLGYGYYYDDYLPYAMICKSNYDGTQDRMFLSRYSSLTSNEKIVNGTNNPAVINASNTSNSKYKDFKNHIYAHGNTYKKK